MSELISTDPKSSLRHTLLVTVSVTTLLCFGFAARASEADERPTVWIEVGGQLDRVGGEAQPYQPSFTILGAQHGLMPVSDLQAAPRFGFGEQGSISFQPKSSDWKFAASIQYGRANKSRYRHQQNLVKFIAPFATQYVSGPNPNHFVSQTEDYTVKLNESHAIVDFKVGKDVGLGLFGGGASSEVALGIRFAQFISHTGMNLNGIPYPRQENLQYFSPFHGSIFFTQVYQIDKAKPEIARNFHGWGPTLSWNGTLPVVKSDDDDAEIAFDFGANVGVLFGRQKVLIQHQTTDNNYVHRPLGPLSGQPKYAHYQYVNSANMGRSRFVAVPNVGGLASISLKLANAKVSFGYRADFFFGAMDGGIDARKTYDRGFYGPFATISVGLGG